MNHDATLTKLKGWVNEFANSLVMLSHNFYEISTYITFSKLLFLSAVTFGHVI